MTEFAGIVFLVILLTIVGSSALIFITVKFYWGERGTPPLTGDAKREQRALELKIRAKQIEHSQNNPRKPRSQNFWDNRKR
jgi:hypothetical protein